MGHFCTWLGYSLQAIQSKLEYLLGNSVLNEIAIFVCMCVTVKWLKNRESLGSDQMPLVTLVKDVAFPLMGESVYRDVVNHCLVPHLTFMENGIVSFLFFGFYFLPENSSLASCVFYKHQLRMVHLMYQVLFFDFSETKGLSVAFHYSYLLFPRSFKDDSAIE